MSTGLGFQGYETNTAKIRRLRKKLTDDSVDRARMLTEFVRLIRDQERTKTLDTLRATRAKHEAEQT